MQPCTKLLCLTSQDAGKSSHELKSHRNTFTLPADLPNMSARPMSPDPARSPVHARRVYQVDVLIGRACHCKHARFVPNTAVAGRHRGSRVQLGLKLGVEIGYINLRQHRAEEVFIQTRHHNWGSAPYAPRGSLDLE